MYCRKCGKQLREEAIFCDQCGEKVEIVEENIIVDSGVIDVESQPVEAQPIEEPKGERGPWKAFAIVGHILGIVSLATMWIPFLVCCSTGFYGIVFSALGKKSLSKKPMADKALKRNIAASIVSFVLTVVIYAIIIIAAVIS